MKRLMIAVRSPHWHPFLRINISFILSPTLIFTLVRNVSFTYSLGPSVQLTSIQPFFPLTLIDLSNPTRSSPSAPSLSLNSFHLQHISTFQVPSQSVSNRIPIGQLAQPNFPKLPNCWLNSILLSFPVQSNGQFSKMTHIHHL